MTGDGQAEPGAAILMLVGFIDFVKAFPDERQIFRGNADAGILTCTEKLNQSLCEFFFPMFFGEFARSFVLQAAMWPEVVILPSPSLDFLPGFRHGTEPVFI